MVELIRTRLSYDAIRLLARAIDASTFLNTGESCTQATRNSGFDVDIEG